MRELGQMLPSLNSSPSPITKVASACLRTALKRRVLATGTEDVTTGLERAFKPLYDGWPTVIVAPSQIVLLCCTYCSATNINLLYHCERVLSGTMSGAYE